MSIAGAGSSYALGLAGLGELAAQSSENDYKALVCVFLRGGNDHANTLIPYDSLNYSRYSQIRGGQQGIAIPHQDLSNTFLRLPEDQILTDDQLLALSPAMPKMKRRYDEGSLAPLLNVGPLLAPLTRAEFDSPNTRAYPRPAKLFSHNDQQSTWEAFQPEGATTGWGGKLGDIALSSNQNTMFTAIGVSGNSVFLNGQDASAFQITPSGPLIMWPVGSTLYGSRFSGDALGTLLRQQSSHVLENDYAMMNARSIEYSAFVKDALENAPASTKFGGSGGLHAQLSIVAQIIASRSALGVKRQVFLVSIGGFDNHSDLKSKHQGLLQKLDGALDAFYASLLSLGVQRDVTTFTASDFGRTLTSNGNGTDHGWGGHHFVLGGNVNGGRFFGRAPSISISSDDQVGYGRLLPTTSVDEYASTLALWFGVNASDLQYVAPNIGRFARPDLGFMSRQ
ncbi:DUF1501 domain-containing protein [Erythrobacter sp. THAF29]|uniref:DUF1501 domain-containing protein n=1 Tax=Erythrobacter sp. THAF29 TaxID=2587851 RepID=UPI001F21A1B4|nr:DUF1501 domain-containing protein [Erythrobacter sp. THAF29]